MLLLNILSQKKAIQIQMHRSEQVRKKYQEKPKFRLGIDALSTKQIKKKQQKIVNSEKTIICMGKKEVPRTTLVQICNQRQIFHKRKDEYLKKEFKFQKKIQFYKRIRIKYKNNSDIKSKKSSKLYQRVIKREMLSLKLKLSDKPQESVCKILCSRPKLLPRNYDERDIKIQLFKEK